MKVKIEYHDNESFLIEEVIKNAKNNYGNSVRVEVGPESSSPLDYIYFGIQRYITGKHLSLIYDSGSTYQIDLGVLRADTLYKLGEILDEVLMDTEEKASV
jgi:hypothetical protein